MADPGAVRRVPGMRIAPFVLGLTLAASISGAADAAHPGAAKGRKPKAARDPIGAARRSRPPAPSIADRRSYLHHLNAGRDLAKAGKWTESESELAAALAIAPHEAVALAEAGWAAFLRGEHAKARRANTEAARCAADPVVKASALYNLGRIAQSQGDAAGARALYERSMKTRANDDARQRLQGEASGAPLGLCAGWQSRAKLEQCAKLVTESRVTAGGSPTCAIEDAPKSDTTRVLACRTERETEAFLVERRGDEYRVLDDLYAASRLDRHTSDARAVKLEERRLGAARILWAEAETRVESFGFGAEDLQRTRELTICLLSGHPGAPRCLPKIPLSATYARFTPADPERDPEGQGMMRSGSFACSVDIHPDGSVAVELGPQKGDPGVIEPASGPFKLW